MNIQSNNIYFKKYLNYKSKYLGLINQQGGKPGVWKHRAGKHGIWIKYSKLDSDYIDERVNESPKGIYKEFKYYIGNNQKLKYYMKIDTMKEEGTQTNAANNTKVRYVKKFYTPEKLSDISYEIPEMPENYNESSQYNTQEDINFRKEVISNTIDFLSLLNNKKIQKQAIENFKSYEKTPTNKFELLLKNEDWGTVTKELTIKYGQKFRITSDGEEFLIECK